ncbi:carbohydrate kinase family protein [Niveibacterium sp. 24ML]|uniref:carbohydrate kinase family protein n=1 Tax=Niveibacterium sp. 24ML TaxID=2985512 RepID=UPI00226FDB99|nr:carbohydrate kinase family protein [Niveibacterium sp. 24ML]MCX9155213.1 carbohydrate kinase family protein [Niveibacterium sp. 24ML]
MAQIAVAGLYTLETNLRIEGFPLPYYPVTYPFHGITQAHAGVGLNVAVALAGLGHSVRFATLIGQDEPGEHLLAALPRFGLDSGFVARTASATSQSVILVAPDGNRQIHCDLKDLQESTYPQLQIEPLLSGASIAVVCNINFARPLLAAAQARGIPIATDVHALGDFDDAYNRDFMAASEVLFLSHERLPCAPQQALEALRARFDPRIIVIGLGADGALLSERGKPAQHVGTVAPRGVANTIGAGDALFSAFVDQLCAGLPPAAALQRACLFAGWKVGESGATLGLLTATQFAQECSRHQL